MGYRSDVGLCLTKAGKKTFDAMLVELGDDEMTKRIHELLDFAVKKFEDKDSGAVGWYWKSIKWYDFACDDFPDIHFIKQVMDRLDESDEESFLFIIVGENAEDNETHGQFWDNPFDMHLMRGVGFSEHAATKPTAFDENYLNAVQSMTCPKCGSKGPFDIKGRAWFRLLPDGSIDIIETNGFDWDNGDDCVCVACTENEGDVPELYVSNFTAKN